MFSQPRLRLCLRLLNFPTSAIAVAGLDVQQQRLWLRFECLPTAFAVFDVKHRVSGCSCDEYEN